MTTTPATTSATLVRPLRLAIALAVLIGGVVLVSWGTRASRTADASQAAVEVRASGAAATGDAQDVPADPASDDSTPPDNTPPDSTPNSSPPTSNPPADTVPDSTPADSTPPATTAPPQGGDSELGETSDGAPPANPDETDPAETDPAEAEAFGEPQAEPSSVEQPAVEIIDPDLPDGQLPDSYHIAPSPDGTYHWHDADRTIEVHLDPGLVVRSYNDNIEVSEVVANMGSSVIVASDTPQPSYVAAGQPVFRSQAGVLMALPGGVILVLDSDWSSEDVNAFFESNDLNWTGVTEIEFLPNAYLIPTAAGFASLALANQLAVQPGVEISSPDWWMETELQ